MAAIPDIFEAAGGTIAGRDHTVTQKNSHDAYHMVSQHGIMVAVVCDGCGSGEHSEVGAKLGARIVTAQVLRWFHDDPGAFRAGQIDRGLTHVRRSTLGQIQLLADGMGESFSKSISEYFLFTVVGAVITPEDFFVFGAGDGVAIVNGGVIILGNDDKGKNQPAYLAYNLVETEGAVEPELKVVCHDRTSGLRSLMLGSDGALDLIKASEKKIPGKDEKVGSIEQFWTDDKVFKNPFTIRRRLNLINRTSTRADFEKKVIHEEHGHLPDDTTLIVIRRRR